MSSTLRQLPNALTVLRILLVGPFVWLMLSEKYEWALWILLVAGLSDGLDGFLARRYGWGSRFGSIADPVADKVLMVSAFLTLGYTGQLAWWAVAVVVLRDIYIFLGAILYWFIVQHYDGNPTLLSKACTFLMVVLGLSVLINLIWPLVPAPAIEWLAVIVGVFCIVSMGQYTVQFLQGYRLRKREAPGDD